MHFDFKAVAPHELLPFVMVPESLTDNTPTCTLLQGLQRRKLPSTARASSGGRMLK